MTRAQMLMGTILCLGCTLPALGQSSFRRGDSNADGDFNISDASYALSYLFFGTAAPPCLDAADSNDDGKLDVSDAPFSLGYLFLGGLPPKAPFESCGTDPTDDALDCSRFTPCPNQTIFPRPDPDPCGQLPAPCDSIVFGPYTLVSTPDGDGVFTIATHENGEVLHLRWTPAVGGGLDLTFSLPDGTATAPMHLPREVPTLRAASILGGISLVLNVQETPDGVAAGGAAHDGAGGGAASGNHAGCDPNGLMGWADCTSCGSCCDTHDVCIDANCNGAYDSHDLRDCLRQELVYEFCLNDPLQDDEDCELLPRCSVDCMQCHAGVVDCFDPCTELLDSGPGPGPSNCCARGDCGQPEQCIDADGVVETDPTKCLIASGDSWGDPHLVTFDRLAYDFQSVGEFILARSLAQDLEVQIRTAPWRNSRHIAVSIAVGLRVAGDRVGLYLGRTPALYVNGEPTELGLNPIELPGGGRVEAAGAAVSVHWGDGSQVLLTSRGAYFDIKVRLSSRRARSVEGLLGNLDGNRANDLVTRGGEVLVGRPTLQQFYQVYGESWRVTAEESLFDYLEGESTDGFTDRTFPDGLASVESLPADARSRAEAACAAAGVTDPILLEACILDVGFTGDEAFAASSGDVGSPGEALEKPTCGHFAVTWTDWTSGNMTMASGQLGDVQVTYTGQIVNAQVQGGINYWAAAPATYTSPGIVDDPPGTTDIIALLGGPTTGVQTLTFSSPVVDPVMAILSLGRPGVGATYDFDTPFEILKFGPGYFGNGTLAAEDGDVLVGKEGYGLIQFHGLITSITWTMPTAEYWHGIQVGKVDCRE